MEIFTFLVTLGGICLFFVCGASAVETDSVFVMEGDEVTLYTDIEMNQQDRMTWFFGDNRIAIINGYQSKICADVQCNEIFRDRLKVNNMTGSLTIMNTRTTDSGLYILEISSSNTEQIFSVTVHGVPVAERYKIKRKSVKEGESVTLESDETKNPNDEMMWCFNETLIAEITGDQRKICTDDKCKERFRDRLEVNQTGSLTITNTRTTDSGLYKLQISSRGRISIIRIFTVTVTYVSDSGSDSGSSSAAAAAVVVVVLLLLIVAAVVFYQRKAIMKGIGRQRGDQRNCAEEPPPEQTNDLLPITTNGTSHNETEAANECNIIYFTEREN